MKQNTETQSDYYADGKPYTATKSKERVRKQAEVYTPPRIVRQMCDALSEESGENAFQPSKTFLEPSCGNGAFLVEILHRKLNCCHCQNDVFESLKSIYAIDIMLDNINESRKRLLNMIKDRCKLSCIELYFAKKIIETNIIHGDFLHDDIMVMDWKQNKFVPLRD